MSNSLFPQTNAYIYFKINQFSKPCTANDASSALSRQRPQAQRHQDRKIILHCGRGQRGK